MPETDLTNGFFVAMFERKPEDQIKYDEPDATTDIEVTEMKSSPRKKKLGSVESEWKNSKEASQIIDNGLSKKVMRNSTLKNSSGPDTKGAKKRDAKKLKDEKAENDDDGVKEKKVKKEQNENIFAKKVPSKRGKRLNQRVKKSLV